jgi:arginyl-tRNA synthetase
MTPLDRLKDLFRPALQPYCGPTLELADLLGQIKPTADPAHGDYQANMAMRLKKAAGKAPAEVAKDLIAALPANELIASATVAGPGFINIKLHDAAIAGMLRTAAQDERLGVPKSAKSKTFVIDYSGPNVAKPLHVGHLRSTIIGDALVRILRFAGHNVVGDNHLGDWGTQFGMLIYGYRTFVDRAKYDSKLPGSRVRELARLYMEVRKVAATIDIISKGYTYHRDEDEFRTDPIRELSRIYINGIKRAGDGSNEDEESTQKPAQNVVAESYRNETAKLHAGDPENVRLWNEFMPACLEELKRVYDLLGILDFDYQYGESFYNNMLPEITESLLAKKVAEVGDGGSVIVRTGKDNVSLIRKRDGAYTYTATDLATVKYRCDEFKPDVILYVVDFRQAQHFSSLFEVAKKWGYDKIDMQHVSFGSVLGKDGKALQTRAGGATELSDLLHQAVELGSRQFELTYWKRKAMGHDVPDYPTEEELSRIAAVVGVGAVKYADLCQNRTSDYRFDFDKMLATEGNTATYMQYAYARCRSIIRKSGQDEKQLREAASQLIFSHAAERALALQLLRFGEAIDATLSEYLPHNLCQYLWELSKTFSIFFNECPVLKADTNELRVSRLILVEFTASILKQALDLLGIQTVERM